jgi:hypothetical protein
MALYPREAGMSRSTIEEADMLSSGDRKTCLSNDVT